MFASYKSQSTGNQGKPMTLLHFIYHISGIPALMKERPLQDPNTTGRGNSSLMLVSMDTSKWSRPLSHPCAAGLGSSHPCSLGPCLSSTRPSVINDFNL
jgi:hypothetical protein